MLYIHSSCELTLCSPEAVNRSYFSTYILHTYTGDFTGDFQSQSLVERQQERHSARAVQHARAGGVSPRFGGTFHVSVSHDATCDAPALVPRPACACVSLLTVIPHLLRSLPHRDSASSEPFWHVPVFCFWRSSVCPVSVDTAHQPGRFPGRDAAFLLLSLLCCFCQSWFFV